MKAVKLVGMAMLMVGLLFTSAQAGPYVGFQIGPNFSAAGNSKVSGYSVTNPTFDTGVALGVQAGFDFNDARYSFPEWAKYFGVAVDYQFNTMNPNNTLYTRSGNQNALAFLGIVKYPMMITKDYPRGRLFPYLGAGPGIVWSSFGNKTSTDVGVVVEPGIRYMFTPKISGNLAYRFRYAAPQFDNVKFDNYNHSIMAGVAYHF